MTHPYSFYKKLSQFFLLAIGIFVLAFPWSVLAAKNELGKQCRVGRLDCNIGSCEDSSQAQSDDNFCDCDNDNDCAEEYADETSQGETWACIDGADATYDLDYCKSSLGKIKTPLPPRDPSFLDSIFDPELTANEIKKMISTPVNKISIPGLTYSEPQVTVENGVTYQHLPYIGNYIVAIYKYLVLALSIIAVVMVIVSGLTWMTSGGNSAQIEAVKERIGKALIGLLITVGSYTMLYLINPDLVAFKNLKVRYITQEPLPYVEGGDTEVGSSDLAVIQADGTFAPPTDTYCPKSGGVAAIPKIVESLREKVVYRYGGKHWRKPPYSEYKPENMVFNNFCPTGYFCFDCSGFISYIHHCAGIKKPTGSGNLLDGTELWNDRDNPIDFEKGTVNGIPLEPGDILGWKGVDPMDGAVGHVLLYVGTIDGKEHQFAESSGAGRTPGEPKTQNPRIRPFTDFRNYFPQMVKKGGGPRYYRLKQAVSE